MRIADRLDDIVRLYGAGLSIQAIAKAMGFSEGGIHRVLTRAGIHKPGTRKRIERSAIMRDRLIRALDALWRETRTLQRCPACLRKRTLWTQDLGELGWIAMCDPNECGFVWYRRNGPPECVQNALCTV
jgi:hypothetical protein